MRGDTIVAFSASVVCSMYIPSAFASEDRDRLLALIRDYPLGALVTQGPEGLDANHLPFAFEADDTRPGSPGRLLAHVARANSVWQAGQAQADVMIIFRGPDHYISPNWYPSKHEAHRQVPTWNYEVVHVHGRLTVRDDPRFVRRVVARLTQWHERTEPQPWKMGDAPADYLDAMVSAIVGLEIEILRMEGKFKLSQNRESRDRAGAAEQLEAMGAAALARSMRGTL